MKSKSEIIASLRKEIESFGMDCSEYSDEDIEKALIKLGAKISKIGFSIKTTTQALLSLSKAGLSGAEAAENLKNKMQKILNEGKYDCYKIDDD